MESSFTEVAGTIAPLDLKARVGHVAAPELNQPGSELNCSLIKSAYIVGVVS